MSRPPSDAAPASSSRTSIGVATMRADGTIELQLRAEGPSGELGDALFTYKPSEPKYQEIIDHLGGLKPGESKPVPPWSSPR